VNRIDPRTRFAAFLLLIALLASLIVAIDRVKIERETRRAEIAMDYNDFLELAHSYNYNPNAFLVQLRRAGLTSLAVSEELGSSLTTSTSKNAFAISGLALADSARVSAIADPTLSALVRSGRVRDGSVYLLVYDKPTFERYMQQLPFHFERSGISVLRASTPYIIAVRTQSDYFNTTALGIPADQVALARRLGLFVIPRFQNDERLSDVQISAMFADLHAGQLRGDRFERAANVVRCVWLGVPDIQVTRAALEEDEDEILGRAKPGSLLSLRVVNFHRAVFF